MKGGGVCNPAVLMSGVANPGLLLLRLKAGLQSDPKHLECLADDFIYWPEPTSAFVAAGQHTIVGADELGSA